LLLALYITASNDLIYLLPFICHQAVSLFG